MGRCFGFGLEVDFAGFPFLGNLHEDACHQAQERGFVGEETDDAGAALDLRVERLAHVGGAQALAAGFGEAEDGEGCGALRVEAGRLEELTRCAELIERLGKPVVGERGRVDASGQLSQVLVGTADPLAYLRDGTGAAAPMDAGATT